MEILNQQVLLDIDQRQLARAVSVVFGEAEPQIHVTIVDNATIAELNREQLGHEGPTDVIAFDYSQAPTCIEDDIEGDVEGEIIVSAEMASEVSAAMRRSPGDELLLYVVHGALHLRGLNDKTPEDRALMRRREREVCQELGLDDPWPSEAKEAPLEAFGEALVYTDGACRGNPGPGGWGLRAYLSEGRIVEKGGAADHTTNNRMELTAAIEALKLCGRRHKLVIVTDSQYVRLGITQWIKGWLARGWKTVKGEAVLNRDLWQALHGLIGPHVTWDYVAGHAGDPDNERCDRIAVGFAEGRTVSLAAESFSGPLPKRRTSTPQKKKSSSKKRRRSGRAVYLSLVGGVVERHTIWAECERRVKGVSNTRYKKCFSPDEEEEVLRGWGLDPTAVKDGGGQ